MTLIFNQKELLSRWVATRIGQQSSWGDYYAMGVEHEGKIIAGILFNGLSESNIYAHMAVDRSTREFVTLLDHAFNYAFNTCKVRRVTATVDEHNTKALRLDEHVGFVREGVLHQAGPGGQDTIILVMWPQNYYRGSVHG